MAQYIKFGELTAKSDTSIGNGVESARPHSANGFLTETERFPDGVEAGTDARLTKEEEDAILKDTAGTFADWVAAFLQRVILLFENLPEEGPNGTAGGATEGKSSSIQGILVRY